ncbi:MAG: SDR family oxidoreductase [Rhodospirillales bacterium]|jgi:3-oxoacyl-[acyl-carrier protein] reductase|nr:SDR family oxidoreductase [Rhodospirillales bacterium]
MIDLTGKTVLVTGGARGIGAEIVRTMADAGADVILHFTSDAEVAGKVASEIGEHRCRVLRADFMDDHQIRQLWTDAVAWKGRVDVLVNNAGVFEAASVEDDFEAWVDIWQRALQINLIASGHLCREAIPHFRSLGGGIIINIASRAAFRGDDAQYMQYAASKGGMVAMHKTIARAFGRENVLSYVLAPGFVRTEMTDVFIAEHGEETMTRDIPLGELATPADVANLAVFLASGKARSATGTSIDINGASFVR